VPLAGDEEREENGMATVTPGGVTTARATLVRMIRVMFPHADIPDGPYERAADAILAAGVEDVRTQAQLEQGLRDLDAATDRAFADLDEAKALSILERISSTPFFEVVRSKVILTLYDDPEVHRLLGYEGASYDQGGYLDRGFADLDWLPDARVEEAD
jgi:hypothetical protein